MTQEDKQLLLKDLCARLPYGVKIQRSYIGAFGEIVDETDILYGNDIDSLTTKDEKWATWKNWKVQPYLRPMSSMTKEELHELLDYNDALNRDCPAGLITILTEQPSFFDYLNSHHFDYRGLIEKGLALEAPDDMYKK